MNITSSNRVIMVSVGSAISYGHTYIAERDMVLAVGDEVVLLGSQGSETINADEIGG